MELLLFEETEGDAPCGGMDPLRVDGTATVPDATADVRDSCEGAARDGFALADRISRPIHPLRRVGPFGTGWR